MAEEEMGVQGGDGAGSVPEDLKASGAPPASGVNGTGLQPDMEAAGRQGRGGARPRQPVAEADVDEDEGEPSEASQIDAYLDQGYSPRQIISMGFARETVRDQAARRMEPEGSKLAKGGKASGGEERIMKLARSEVIPPEEALKGIRLQDGEYKLGFTDGIRVLLLAVRYTQELATLQANMMDPTIKMVQSMREEERIAAERARGSGEAIASRAAQEAVGRVGDYFEQRLSSIEEKAHAPPAGANPMAEMMARVMEPYLKGILGTFLGGTTGVQEGQQGQRAIPGFTYEPAKGGSDG